MAVLDKVFGKNVKAILLPAFLWSLPITILSYLLAYAGTVVGFSLLFKQERIVSMLPFIGSVLVSGLLSAAVFGLFLYLGLRSVSKKVPMKTYESKVTFSMYLIAFIIVVSTGFGSLLEGEVRLSGVGLLSLGLAFLIPAIYKPRHP